MNNKTFPWLMLFSRSALFLFFQSLIALILFAAGTKSAWDESARWWTFVVSLANCVSLYLLVRLFKSEGKNYWDILRFSRETWKSDLLFLLGFSVVGLPIAAAPREPLAIAIFRDVMTPTMMMFRALPTWAFVLSFIFPLTIWFSELPTYFGYCMPRLFRAGESQTRPYLAWIIASFLPRNICSCRSFSTADTCFGASGCSCPSRSSADSRLNSARVFCHTSWLPTR